MQINDIAPYFVLMTFFFLFAGVLDRIWKFGDDQGIGSSKSAHFNVTLESLRGVLALSVIFHHALITFYFFKSGSWAPLQSVFYELMGQIPVLLFFFLSGYLFWTKLQAEGKSLNILNFFRARFRRLLPVYYFSCCFVVAGALYKTNFHLVIPPKELIKEIAQWLSVGIYLGFPAINGYPETPYIVAGVVWTLRYEVLFYFCLPLLPWFTKQHRIWILFTISGLLWALGQWIKPSVFIAHFSLDLFIHFAQFMTMGFGFGMLTAYLKRFARFASFTFFKSRGFTVIPLVFMVCAFLLTTTPQLLTLTSYSYCLELSFLLWIPFLFIAFGNSIFGLLATRPLIYLGKISYSIYLTHGIILYVVSRVINHYRKFESLSGPEFWTFVAICGLITLILSTLLYEYLELPFMRKRNLIPVERTRLPVQVS